MVATSYKDRLQYSTECIKFPPILYYISVFFATFFCALPQQSPFSAIYTRVWKANWHIWRFIVWLWTAKREGRGALCGVGYCFWDQHPCNYPHNRSQILLRLWGQIRGANPRKQFFQENSVNPHCGSVPPMPVSSCH